MSNPPTQWTLLLGLAALRFALYVASVVPSHYGLMTDEVYYLDCTHHLAWGYVDHPPLSVAVLWLARTLLGDSIAAVRLVPALIGCVTVVLVGRTARDMGGGPVAQGLAALFALTSPLLLATTLTYTMNALELLLWTLAAWLLVRILGGADRRLWLALGAILGLGLLNKLSMAWFGFGLAVALLVTPERRWLATRWPWLAVALALALFAPNLAWQARHDWAMAEFLHNTGAVKEFTFASPGEFLLAQLFVTGLPFWLLGLAHLFSNAGRTYRPLAWIWISVFLLLLASGSAKPYYTAPAYPLLLAAAGLPLERLAGAWRRPVVAGTAAAAACVGVFSLPMVATVVAPERLAAGLGDLGLTELTVDVTEASPLPQHFAQMFHADAVLDGVERALAALPPDEREGLLVLTSHFGEAAPLNVYGPARGLPPAIGTHVSYWLWGPGNTSGERLIVISETEAWLRQNWSNVEKLAEIECAYCMPYLARKAVYRVRGLRRPFSEVWRERKDYT